MRIINLIFHQTNKRNKEKKIMNMNFDFFIKKIIFIIIYSQSIISRDIYPAFHSIYSGSLTDVLPNFCLTYYASPSP